MAERMKESGIQWIGLIPYDWNVKRIKHIIQNNDNGIKVGPFGSALTNEVVSSDEGQYKVYGQSNLIRKDFLYGDNYVSEQNYKRLINYEVLPNDIVVSMMGTIGKCSVVPDNIEPGIMDSHLIKIRLSKKMLPRYFEYAYESDMGYSQLLINSKGSIMNGLNSTIIKGLYIPVPGIIEQQSIVDFLDKECGQIDSIATDLEKQIALLQQYKKSLITETVTKGLDKSAPMKDSGVEWIGKIPEHWELKHLKYLTKSILDGTHLTPTYTDDGIPFLRVTDITSGDGIDAEINLDSVARISKEEHRILCQRCYPQKGDVLVSKNGTIGVPKIIDWDWEFSIFVSLCLIKLNESLLNKWLFYYFKSTLVATEIAFAGKTNTITNLHLEKIANFKIPLPSVEEQKLIATYLDEKVCKIDALIKEKQNQLETLRQHKKSLIYEYITGKKRVKEVR